MKHRIAILTGVIAALLVAPDLVADKRGNSDGDARYYPLAVGNVWTYEVVLQNKAKHSRSTLTWTVTHSDAEDGRTVYQIWPKPMQADDEAIQLAVTPEGILEVTDNTIVLRFPITAGDEWTQTPRGAKYPKSYFVRSAEQPCEVKNLKMESCVVVEENDPATHLKIVTTYGRDIGPVRCEFYTTRAGKQVLIQTVTLTAHRFHVR